MLKINRLTFPRKFSIWLHFNSALCHMNNPAVINNLFLILIMHYYWPKIKYQLMNLCLQLEIFVRSG